MSGELTPFDEWANTPHAQLGFSPRQLQAQEVLVALQALTLERDELLKAIDNIHGFNCGCDKPGQVAYCVAKPVSEFATRVKK